MLTQWSYTKISPFGGVVPILRNLQELKIPELIGSCLGQRVKQAKYSNENILTSWVLTQLTSGFRLLKIEDSEKEFSQIPELNIPSHDTMGRFFKKLATPTQTLVFKNAKQTKKKPVEYKINENPKLNELLVQSALAVGVLKKNTPYCLDIDLTILHSETKEARMSYKGFMGYTSMVCTIGKIPVYVDIRSGNATSKFRLIEAMASCLEILRKYEIIVDTVRSDGAGYSNSFLDYLDSEKLKFNVGADGSKKAEQTLLAAKNWRTLRFQTSNHDWEAEFASVHYSLSRS